MTLLLTQQDQQEEEAPPTSELSSKESGSDAPHPANVVGAGVGVLGSCPCPCSSRFHLRKPSHKSRAAEMITPRCWGDLLPLPGHASLAAHGPISRPHLHNLGL